MAIKLMPALPARGVNLLEDPLVLRADECQWAQNVWPKSPGIISPRGSLEHVWHTVRGRADGPMTVFNAVNFRKDIKQAAGSSSAVATAAVVWSSSGTEGTQLVTWRFYNAGMRVGVALRNISPPMGRGCFVDIGFGAFLYLDGNGPGWVISDGTLNWVFWGVPYALDVTMFNQPAAGIASWGLLQANEDGPLFATTLGDRSHIGNPKTYAGGLPAGWRPRIGVMVRERLVYLNLADTHRDAMVWSDRNNPGLVDAAFYADAWWSSTTGLLDVDGPYSRLGGDNQDITAAAAVATSNEQNLVEQSLLVWKRDRVYLVQGEPAQTNEFGTSPEGTLTVKELAVRAGCVGQQAWCATPYGLFWVGPDDVWFMATGSLPVRVGTKISPRLKAQAVSDGWKAQCAYAAGRLHVAIVPAGGGGADASVDEQWWLDLRRGPPQGWQDAMWFGPQAFTTSVTDFTCSGVQFLLKDEDADALEALVSLERTGDDVVPGWGASTEVTGSSMDGDSGVDSPIEVAGPYPWVPSSVFSVDASICPPTESDYTPSGLGGDVNRTFPYRSGLPTSWPNHYENMHRPYYVAATAGAGLSGATPPSFLGGVVTDGDLTWWNAYVMFGSGGPPVATPRQLKNNAVLVDILSRAEALGDSSVVKNFDGVELTHDLGSPLVVDLIALGSGVTFLTDRQSEGASPQGGQMAAGQGRADQNLLVAPALGTRFLPAGVDGARSRGFSHAFRLKTKSFVVLERIMPFTFWVDSSGALGTAPFTAQVPAGRYATVDDLILALNTSIAAAMLAGGATPVSMTFGYAIGVDANESPFVWAYLNASSSVPVGIIDVAIPLMSRSSVAQQVGRFTLPAGPRPWDTVHDCYDDTSFLMELLGYVSPATANRGVYLYYGTNDPAARYPNATFASVPTTVQRAYSRFNIYEMKMRFRTFAKRPT